MACVDAGTGLEQVDRTMERRAVNGEFRLVYLTPEKLSV